jgi:hypothetical protein
MGTKALAFGLNVGADGLSFFFGCALASVVESAVVVAVAGVAAEEAGADVGAAAADAADEDADDPEPAAAVGDDADDAVFDADAAVGAAASTAPVLLPLPLPAENLTTIFSSISSLNFLKSAISVRLFASVVFCKPRVGMQ